jgi:capsular exopolysaccharide synthesis family protein
MTKIFEALQKAGGEIPEVVLPAALEGHGSTSVPAALNAVEPVFLPERPRESSHPAEAMAEFGDPAAALRTVSLRLSAKDPLFPIDGVAGEQYRIIRTKLIHHPKQPRMIAVVSPGSGDGKTVTSINLAGTLSLKKGTDVLLIDTDLRRAEMAKVLGLPSEPGLADILARDIPLEEAMVRIEQFPNLRVIPAGKSAANPGELLDSQRWRQLCVELRNRFHFMILDTPPIGPVADYDLIQGACDGVVMVLRPDKTKRSACMEALKAVPKDKFLGVITNAAEHWFLRKPQAAYYYYAGAESR